MYKCSCIQRNVFLQCNKRQWVKHIGMAHQGNVIFLKIKYVARETLYTHIWEWDIRKKILLTVGNLKLCKYKSDTERLKILKYSDALLN